MGMQNNLSKSIAIYKAQLAQGDIQVAYITLTKYVAELKAEFPSEYTAGGISFGYLDYTYFPFFNAFLRERKLRFGIVLNHEKMQFELWLMGQNAVVQKNYWEVLKDTSWNKGINTMPQYSVLEVVLESNIDFDNKNEMTQAIIKNGVSFAESIQHFLETQT